MHAAIFGRIRHPHSYASRRKQILRALLGGRAGCIRGQGGAAQEVAGYYLSLAGARVRCLCFDARRSLSLSLCKRDLLCLIREQHFCVYALSVVERGIGKKSAKRGFSGCFPAYVRFLHDVSLSAAHAAAADTYPFSTLGVAFESFAPFDIIYMKAKTQ
jgi:hypothetical protein